MARIFISHAGSDKPLVDELFDLLQTGCDLRREMMFCSSVEGAGIQTGADFARWIKENMGDASLVILLLTPNFYASKFCLAEMGAAWALERAVFPLMTPDVARDPGVVFLGKQSARIDSTGLDELRDMIATFNPETGKATPRWSIKKETFLERVGEILPKLPKPTAVDRDKLEEETKRATAARELYKESESKVRGLHEQIRLLEAAKDSIDVQAIRAQFTPALQRFHDLKAEARTLIGRLDRVEARALYAKMSEDPWKPSLDVSAGYDAQMTKALKSGWISEVGYGYGGTAYVANESHPKFAAVISKLRELESTIEDLPPEVRADIEQEAECLLGVGNWQFWEEELLDYPLLQ